MTDRTALAARFLDGTDWAGGDTTPLAGDASSRRYERITHPTTGEPAVLMDADPATGNDSGPFVHIAQHLTSIGLSAPKILAQDPEHGFLLLEDLGNDLFARIIRSDPSQEETLYTAATDLLTHLHKSPPPKGLVTYDAPMLTRMTAPVFDWYMRPPKAEADRAKQQFFATFEPILTRYAAKNDIMLHRDYHAENLLWLPQRTGVARVGLIDFQDALIGHRAYDLVSLLQDARRDVPKDIEAAMIARYVQQNGYDPDDFGAAYAALGAQRNLRILGIFARLSLHVGKPHYVDLIPRVWRLVLHNLDHPALIGVKDIVLQTLPAPTPEFLQRLKDACGTVPTP